MNEVAQQTPVAEANKNVDEERTKQVIAAGWTAGLSAFFALGALAASPTWPVAAGVTAVVAMVAVVCYFILKK
jgi:dihydrodipicolinate synthase/N-acetylneuraminate lyase